MLISALGSLFFGLLELLFSVVPVLDLMLPSEFLTVLSWVVSACGYFLPMQALVPIFLISIAIDFHWIWWRLFLRIKSFVPTWGN